MNQKVKPQKSASYYILTVFIALIFIVISLTMAIYSYYNSYDDHYFWEEVSYFILGPIFIIGAGLCGFEYGLSMLIAFYFIPLFIHGNTAECVLMTIPYFLTLVLVSGDIFKRLYRKVSYTIIALILILLLNFIYMGSGLYEETFLIAMPLELAAIIILFLYFRFVPDNIKKSFGMGIYYTKEYSDKIKAAKSGFSDEQKEISFTETNTYEHEKETDKSFGSSNAADSSYFMPKPKAKHCPNCRTWYDEDHQFCFSCGAKLVATAGNTTAQNKPVYSVPPTPSTTTMSPTMQCPNCRLLFKNKEKCPVCGSELVAKN